MHNIKFIHTDNPTLCFTIMAVATQEIQSVITVSGIHDNFNFLQGIPII